MQMPTQILTDVEYVCVAFLLTLIDRDILQAPIILINKKPWGICLSSICKTMKLLEYYLSYNCQMLRCCRCRCHSSTAAATAAATLTPRVHTVQFKYNMHIYKWKRKHSNSNSNHITARSNILNNNITQGKNIIYKLLWQYYQQLARMNIRN